MGRLLIIAALPCLSACATMDSLNPILADSDAIALPGLVGSWGTGDSIAFEIRQVADRPPGYLAVSINEIVADTGAVDSGWSRAALGYMPRPAAIAFGRTAPIDKRRPTTLRRSRPTLYDVRIGKLAGRLIAERVPSMVGDTMLSRMVRDYGQIRLTHMAIVLELRGDTLLLFEISPDSARETLQRRQCVSPFITWPHMFASADVEFTGPTNEVRSTYECLMRQPGVVSDSAARLHRISPH